MVFIAKIIEKTKVKTKGDEGKIYSEDIYIR